MQLDVAFLQILEARVPTQASPRGDVDIDQIHAACWADQPGEMIDDRLFSPTVVSQYVAQHCDIDASRRYARLGCVTGVEIHVADRCPFHHAPGLREGLRVALDTDDPTLRSDDLGQDDRDGSRATSDVGHRRAGDDTRVRPVA